LQQDAERPKGVPTQSVGTSDDSVVLFSLRCLRLWRHYQRCLFVRLQFIAEHEDVWRGLDAQADFVARDANDGQNYGIA
jgi:hypothetical protein